MERDENHYNNPNIKFIQYGHLTIDEKSELFRNRLDDFHEHAVQMHFGDPSGSVKLKKFNKTRKWYYDRLDEIQKKFADQADAES